MPLRYTARLLEHLAHGNYRPIFLRKIALEMRVGSDDRPAFEAAVERLLADERIEIGRDEKVRLPAMPDEITGRFKQNPRGFGFVMPEHPFQGGDLFIPPGQTGNAVSGDTVLAKVKVQAWRGKGKPGRSDVVGEIIEVVERGQEHFVGTLTKKGRQWLVEPDGRSLHEPVVIRDPHAKNARAGDKVVIELVQYPEGDFLAEGVITSVLGEAGEPDVETQAVITAHGLRTEFPEAAVTEAGEAARVFDEASRDPGQEREDLTKTFIFTIDPPDAKDFDDAISLEYNEKLNEWILGVHIADVAYFVPKGSALDLEAMERGNSVYLPRHVIPMLPEVLSNGVCSLQEGVNRFAKSVFITFDERGRVMSQRLSSTVIRSVKRMTYLEAQALIDGDKAAARKHARTAPSHDETLIEKLQMANRLARCLRKRRLGDGMIVLNLPDVELVFDDDGNVTDAVPEDDAYTHTIIEMFMVEANEALARIFDDLGIPILRRIHPDPSFGDMTELRQYAMSMQIRLPEEPTREDMQRLLNATRDNPAGRAIHFAVLRTLSKATYSPATIGHFALASEHYAHFTSPIRRYPDLTLHRAVAAFLDLTENGRKVPGGRKRGSLGRSLLDDKRVLGEDDLITLGRHCSDSEQGAAAAERELRDYLVMKFLHDNHLGDSFTGVVTGMISRGVFVSIERFLVEGLVRFQDLPSSGTRADRWNMDERSGRLVAQRSGQSLGVGDIVTVQIVAVDLGSRNLELTITEMIERKPMPEEDRKLGTKKSERAPDRRKGRMGNKGKGKGKGKNRGKGRR